jgi:hypothetical protein
MTDRLSTGGDTDSYCTKCKLSLEHIILAMIGGDVVKVQCKTCGSIHKFRGMPSLRPKSPRRVGPALQSSEKTQELWETAVREATGAEMPYSMEGAYHVGDVIIHNTFGKGVVQMTSFEKCSVLFKDKKRVLVTTNT